MLALRVHFPVDGAASEELASEDIWGDDDDDADTGMEDDSARPTAQSPEEAAPGPEKPTKAGTRSGTRKRQSGAPAQGDSAPKRQRGQPKKPQGAKKNPTAKPAARGAPSKAADSSKGGQIRKRSRGPGSAAAGPSEPDEASETPSDMQAAKAEFMRTMGLPEPRAFSSGSKGTANRPQPKLRPAVAQKRVRDGHAAGGSQQAPGEGALTQTLARSQPGLGGPEPASLLQQEVQQGPMHTDQQQSQPLEQAHPKAARSPDASAETAAAQEPGRVAEHAAIQAASQIHATTALNRSMPVSASPEVRTPQDSAGAVAEKSQPASLAHHQSPAPEQRLEAGATFMAAAESAMRMDQDHALAFVSGEAAGGQPGSSPAPASPEVPQPVQMLGGSGRPAENGVKLVNLLNPNNPQYNQAFALEYARMKCASWSYHVSNPTFMVRDHHREALHLHVPGVTSFLQGIIYLGSIKPNQKKADLIVKR